MEKTIIDAIEKKIGYEFSNKALLIQAFTRESYAKEQRVKGIDCNSNEQLEYFGDSVLNYLVVSGQLDYFTKTNEETGLQVLYKEGKLSEFNSHWTNKKMLSQCIEALGLADYLIMSKGDIKQEANKTDSVKEDLFESIVGAMWIDSDKDVSRIQDKVFKMLGISFESAEVEKNYVSQLIEYADKWKYPLKSQIKEDFCGFVVEYTITLTFLPKIFDEEGRNEQDWSATGVGRNIKAAEQNAAKELIKVLYNYGWFDKKGMPKFDFDTNNAINVLQELNQKGYIGEITYTDTLEFSAEKKPYWRVDCKIDNYVTSFTGTNESKKIAKKEAAFVALMFIEHIVGKTSDYNPAYKYFKFIINKNGNDPELRVIIIDKMNGNFSYEGRIFPENKVVNNFESFDSFSDGDGNIYDTYEDPIEAIMEYIAWYGINGECYSSEDSYIKLMVMEAYEKLSDEIKNNGVLLREALLEIATKIITN